MDACVTNGKEQQTNIEVKRDKLKFGIEHTLVTDEEDQIPPLGHLRREVLQLRIEHEHTQRDIQTIMGILQQEVENSDTNNGLIHHHMRHLQRRLDLLEEAKTEMHGDIQQLKEHRNDQALNTQQQMATNVSMPSLLPRRSPTAMPSILTRNITNSDDGLPLDTFTLMMTSRIRSRAWVLGILTFALQMTLIIMIGINQINDSIHSSLFDVPFKVDGVVRAGQLLTIVFTLATQNDVISSVRFLVMFWRDPRWDRALLRRHEGAPPPTNTLRVVRILLPNGLKFIQGLLVICTTFVVIVKSDDIIDLLKDFTALMMISETDNIFFWLAVNGYLGSELQKKTIESRDIDIQDEVTATHAHINRGPATSVRSRTSENKGGFITRSLILLSIGMAMVGGWLYIVNNQLNGTYFHRRYPDCKPPDDQPDIDMFVLAREHFGDEVCYGGPLNTLGCQFEGGDCVNFNLAFPLCKGTNRIHVQEHVGNGKCEEIFKGIDCNFDGGDCCPDKVIKNLSFGNGQCNGGISSTEACIYDNGDCSAFHLAHPDCPVYDLSRIEGADDVVIGDGSCDSGVYNSYECGYEFGDCNQYQIGQDVYIPDHFELLFDKDVYFNTDLSLDGTTVAISLPYNDEDGNFGINYPGLAKILRYDSTRKMWLQLGSNIAAGSNDFKNNAGYYALSLSADGNRVAIQSSSGLQIFDFNDATSTVGYWSQVGQTITSGAPSALPVTGMSITADGWRVAQIQSEGEINLIRIYDLESSSDSRPERWVIDDHNVIIFLGGGTATSDSYTKLKFNALDGSRILCSSDHSMKLYRFNRNANPKSWAQIGKDIHIGHLSIGSFAISADGNRIAVSLYNSTSIVDAIGQVNVFDYNVNTTNGGWVQIGDPIKSSSSSNGDVFGYSINMSSDGNLLVIASNNPRCQEYNQIQFNIDECSTGSIELYNYNRRSNRFQEVLPNSASPYKATGNVLNLADLLVTSDRSIVFGLHFSMSGDGDVISISGYNVYNDQTVFVRMYDLDELFYTQCTVDKPDWIGDGLCNDYPPFNTEECGIDGGDCDRIQVKGYPKCYVHWTERIGDRFCHDYAPYNTEECGFDGGDCDRNPVKGYPECFVHFTDEIGDGYCTDYTPYNTEECGWDGGDCRPPP